MTVAAFVLLGGAALGLWLVPTAPRAARAAAWLLLLAFMVPLACVSIRVLAVEVGRPVAVDLPAGPEAAATALLAAAARCGPRAVELTAAWREPLVDVGAPPARALGAAAVAPPPLSFEPSAVAIRRTTLAERGRPLGLRVEAPRLAQSLSAELIVDVAAAGGAAGAEGGAAPASSVLRADLQIGAEVVELSCVPSVAAVHRVRLRVTLPGRLLELRGSIEVAAPRQVLVLEPSGVAARALSAQGVAVRPVDALPVDWRDHQALVLGAALSAAEQQELVAAVLDGLGLFVLAPGFGADGEPLRALLPLRVMPDAAAAGDPGAVAGAGTDPGRPSPPALPPVEPPPSEPPPGPPPPIGSTDDARPVSNEPIDVDKHTIAMVLVVDRSGSMGMLLANGRSKMSYAKTSALRTAEALDEGDLVGVVTFGNKGAGQVELRMTRATDRAAVTTGIERLAHAAERTYLLSGLRLAHEMLGAAEAAVKHVVVITDGEFDPSEAIALRAEAFRMRTENHVTVSLISIVDQSTDPQFGREAELLTRDGGGRFLMVDDARSVPVFVSAEVTRALSRVGRKARDVAGVEGEPLATAPPPTPEPPTAEPPAPTPPASTPAPREPEAEPATRLPVRAVAESPLLAPHPSTWPSLGGARATTAPLDVQVLLVAGDDGRPLLAFANRGLGRVGAFAADLGGQEGAEFRAAAAFPAWLAQWLASVSPVEPWSSSPRVDFERDIEPPAPRPAEVDLLAGLAGGPVAVDARPLPPVERFATVDPVAAMAPWLLLCVLVFAVVERLLIRLRLLRPERAH